MTPKNLKLGDVQGEGVILGGFTKNRIAAVWRKLLATDVNTYYQATSGLEKSGIPVSVLTEIVDPRSDLAGVKYETLANIARATGLPSEVNFSIGDHTRKR